MSFTWRLCLVLTLLVTCAGGLAWANWSQPAEIEQTLPSAYFGANDDIQYFPPGPEFKLQRDSGVPLAVKP